MVLYVSIMLSVCIGITGILPGTVAAADCVVVGKSIKKERNLLKKRKLLEQSIEECSSDPTINYYYAYFYHVEHIR